MAPRISKERYPFYQPLDAAKKEIRIIDLQPGVGRLVCHLRTISIADETHTPAYDALSYVWGQRRSGKSVTVVFDGKRYEMPVTVNLRNALCNIRPRLLKPMSLWVDAICIEQSNDGEKNLQVPMMGEIYKSAKRVHIWLGENQSDILTTVFLTIPVIVIRLCMLPFDAVDEAWNSDGGSHRIDQAAHVTFLKHVYRTVRLMLSRKTRLIEFTLRHPWYEAREWHDRAWHNRAWVFQEYFLARKTVYHIGRRRMKGPLTNHVRHAHRDLDTFRLNSVQSLVAATSKWDSLRGGADSADLFALAIAAAETLASEPKDKVYSLLGLLPLELRNAIKPDYSPTFAVWEAYSTATFASFCYTRTLHFGCVMQRYRYEKGRTRFTRTPDLPTWAADFANLREFSESWVWSATPMDVVDLPTLSEDHRCLTISGARFAQIKGVWNFPFENFGDNTGFKGEWNDSGKEMRKLLSEWWKLYCAKVRESLPDIDDSLPSKVETLADFVVECGMAWRRARTSAGYDDALTAADAQIGGARRSSKYPGYLQGYVDGILPFVKASRRLSLWITTDGYFGFSPSECSRGDIVVHACGMNALLVLNRYRLNSPGLKIESLAHVDHPAVCYLHEDVGIRKTWSNFEHDERFELW